MIDPEIGFTSDVIRDPSRFVGRAELIRDCIRALNTSVGLIAAYGKRGVGKSSLLRQVQQIALGDYTIALKAGLSQEIPSRPRQYLTVYYSCDSMIETGEELLTRLCNDQDEEDGLLRLVPDEGKELAEFTRSKEVNAGADLKLVNWGTKGVESTRYARVVEGDIVQTFRNFVSSIVTHQAKRRMKRDGLLILLDEFDVIRDKQGIGSLIKSLTSRDVKFAICGIGRELGELVYDHASVERLLEQGAIHVRPMSSTETESIISRAEQLFKGAVSFGGRVRTKISDYSQGYPYFAQLLGKECVQHLNRGKGSEIDQRTFGEVEENIRSGKAFPTLESAYQRAIGQSPERQLLLHLLAEQPEEADVTEAGQIFLQRIRRDAEDLDIQYIDQLIPRLIDEKYGPVLTRVPDKRGAYEFVNPALRLYVRLRVLE